MSFAKNLRNELSYKDIKIKEFSKIANIPYTTLLSYINYHEVLPNVVVGVKIAKALDVSLEYLVTGVECSYEPAARLNSMLDKITMRLEDILKLTSEIIEDR